MTVLLVAGRNFFESFLSAAIAASIMFFHHNFQQPGRVVQSIVLMAKTINTVRFKTCLISSFRCILEKDSFFCLNFSHILASSSKSHIYLELKLNTK